MNATVVELQRRCSGCVSYTCIPNEYLTSRLNSMVVVVKDLINEGQPGRRSDVECPCRHVRVQRPRLCTGYHPVAVRRSDRSRTAVCTRKEDAAMSPLRRYKVAQCSILQGNVVPARSFFRVAIQELVFSTHSGAVASISVGSWGQDPTNFFPCPGPHISGPGLNFHKI